MDAETHPGPDHDFGAPQWVEFGGYNPSQQSPLSDFSGFAFGSSPVMPMEPAYSMSIPQPYTSQQLLPLTMSQQWTGMISSQPGFAPVPLAPMPSSMPSMGARQPIHHSSHYPNPPTPRKTLTDENRREMCLYHERNPSIKQTEIGAMFGVERSTVSKVLRQKEKYLYPDDGSRSPVKRSSRKFPDIDIALSNWVRKRQREGGELSDAMIREKALFFAKTVGAPSGHQKIMTPGWLEKFKQKNYLTGPASRKNSIDHINTVDSASNEHSSVQTPNNSLSPDTNNTSPVSPKQEQESAHNTPKLDGNEFAGSLPQHTKASAEIMSRSPSVSSQANGLFTSEDPFCSSNPSQAANNSKRPRSQTFPITGTEPGLVSDGPSSAVSPKSVCQGSMTIPAIDEEDQSPHEPTAMKRNRSNPEIKTSPMQPPPLPKSNTMSPVNSSPDSPTQYEARKALELVMNYFQHQPSGLVAQDYVTIGKLMEKLELAQSQAAAAAAAAAAHSRSLQRIDEYPDGPRVTKKRSIHTI